MGRLPQTPEAKKVIEYAISEAVELNHNYVGTDHLLLGLLREQDSVAAQVLTNLGLNLSEIRRELLSLLGVESKGGEDTRAGAENESALLSLLIDPGSATGEDIAELYFEISKLYRMIGGSGVNFTVIDVKEPQVA